MLTLLFISYSVLRITRPETFHWHLLTNTIRIYRNLFSSYQFELIFVNAIEHTIRIYLLFFIAFFSCLVKLKSSNSLWTKYDSHHLFDHYSPLEMLSILCLFCKQNASIHSIISKYTHFFFIQPVDFSPSSNKLFAFFIRLPIVIHNHHNEIWIFSNKKKNRVFCAMKAGNWVVLMADPSTRWV